MQEEELRRCVQLSEEVAASLPQPLFYEEKGAEVETSRRMFEEDGLVCECLDIVAERYDRMGHGLTHVRKVAVDAGALVLIEAAGWAGDGLDGLVHLAHLAGTLHDVKRAEQDHARKGAEEAGIILADCGLEDGDIRMVVTAIRNHEAFREMEEIDEAGGPVDLRHPLRCRQVPLGAGQFHSDGLVHARLFFLRRPPLRPA